MRFAAKQASRGPRQPSAKDWFARLGAIASAFVAIASLAVSSASYREQKHQFEEVQVEKLAITLEPIEYVPIRVTKIKFGDEGRVVIASWKLTLSNIGQQRLSVTSYEISQGSKPGQKLYTGLNSGMFDSKNDLVELPITMEPGDSKVFTLSIGMLVENRVADALEADADPKSGFVMKPAIALAKKSLDLSGNKVLYRQYDSGSTLIVRLSNRPGATYWFTAKTGRSNSFYGRGVATATDPELERLGVGQAK